MISRPLLRLKMLLLSLKKMSPKRQWALALILLVALVLIILRCVSKRDEFLTPPVLGEWREVRYGTPVAFVIWLSCEHRLAARFSYRPKTGSYHNRKHAHFVLDTDEKVAQCQQTNADSYPRYCLSPACGEKECAQGICGRQCKGKPPGPWSAWDDSRRSKMNFEDFKATCNSFEEYQRGHLVTAGHMTASKSLYDSTFTMTNISPMAPALNNGAWKDTEELSLLWEKHVHVYGGSVWDENAL